MFKIVYFQRKRRAGANFSLEQIFNDLAECSRKDYLVEQKIMPFVSSGLSRRIINMLSASCSQGDLNHVTGDINYVAILLRSKKTISTILDLGVLHRTTGLKREILLLIWFYLPVKRSKWVTVISEATKQDLLKNINCNPDKVKVIYVPISKDFKRSDREFNTTKPTILQIGGAQNKNLTGLIKAVSNVSCHLLIIGKISPENEVLLENLKIDFENHIGISHEGVIDAYRRCDILFFASTFEGFGMPILEAQATGRPVITSNILSMPEVGGDAAVYVNPYDHSEIRMKIIELINDIDLRKSLVEKGFENIKRFDSEKILLQYKELYSDILENQLVI
jgi:glycosyltransferase involved in cell wall biosynthesis